jgi:hypothetical protein
MRASLSRWALCVALGAPAAVAGCPQHPVVLPPPIAISIPSLPPVPSPPAPAPTPPPQPLILGKPSLSTLAAVCTAALRAIERSALVREPTGALLLQRFDPPDTALERELVRRRVVAGICEVASLFSSVCTNGARGLTASFGPVAVGNDVAFAVIRVRPMRATGDLTWLVQPEGHSWFVTLWRSDSVWVAAAGARSP